MSGRAINKSKPQSTESGLRPIFTYGSLMSPQVLSRVLKGKLPIKTVHDVLLYGYKRVQVLNAPYPAIYETTMENSESNVVTGKLYYFDEDSAIEKLDVFESCQYERRTVQVHLHSETSESNVIDADVYVWALGSHYLSDLSWDYDLFLKERLPLWLQDGSEFGDDS